MTREEALRRVLVLKGLPDETLAVLAAAGRERVLSKGELLFSEGERCLGLIVVLEGAVRVVKTDDRGRELTLGLETPGSSVAELPLFDGGNYPAGGEAAEEGTRLFIIPRDRFLELLDAHPQIARQALRSMAVRMRRLLQMVEAQTLHSVRARLAAYLLDEAAGRPAFRLSATNDAIAAQIGTVRDVVSRTLSALRDSGLIALNGRAVQITDPAGLQRLGGGANCP